MPVPGPFGPAPRQPARPPSSVASTTGACVAETPVRTFINAAPATSPDTAHEIVAQGKRPAGVPLHQQSPWTPVHLDRLESALAKHPERAFVNSLVHDMRDGAVIGYSGDRSHFVAPNLVSAFQNPQAVSTYLSNECIEGRMAGPYTHLPHADLRCSGVGVVPKKSGKLRLILHLSAPQGTSINDGISQDEFSLHYMTVDDAVRLLHRHGKGALLSKVDLRNAFRLCPVAPSDWPLLGIHWDNAFYVDKFLPFGLRSSPFLFNRLADALCWVATNRFNVHDLLHYLDDFLTVQPPQPPNHARRQFHTLLAVMEHLQVPLAEDLDKVCPPSTIVTFLGINLDS
eukprot:scpid16664/ scgid24012/ 